MLSFVVAMDRNRTIGYQNEMPWYIPNDFRFFKETTTGHTIVMGRKTFESIGKVLPNRQTIVLTRGAGDFPEEVEVVHEIKDIVKRFKAIDEEVFIIGGGHIFTELLPHADRLYITEINESFNGDVFFPKFNKDDWEEVSKEKGLKDEKNPYDYYFIQYDRISG